jgi:hypothetical protein
MVITIAGETQGFDWPGLSFMPTPKIRGEISSTGIRPQGEGKYGYLQYQKKNQGWVTKPRRDVPTVAQTLHQIQTPFPTFKKTKVGKILQFSTLLFPE